MGRLEVLNPFNLELIEELDFHSEKDVEKALDRANKFEACQPLPKHQRIDILLKTKEILASSRDEIIRTATLEGGKPWGDTEVEFLRGLQGIDNAIEVLKGLSGEEIPMGITPSSGGRVAFTTKEPIGTVVAVSAFNHPFNLIIHQVIPAVASGCPVIVKPALTTPLSCLKVADALAEAGLPEGWCQTLILEDPLAEKLVTDSRVRFFTFIGSAKVGWYLRSQLAPGTRCALEHGGVAPVVIEPDADVDELIPLIGKGGFYHAGQVCVSVQKVFAHELVKDQVAEKLAEFANRQKVGDPLDSATEVGPLILPRENERIASWVAEAHRDGAEILSGGEKLSETLYKPTVIVNPSDSSQVSQKEIFGPVVNLHSYKNRHEAFSSANSLPFSFQASVFTKNIDVALEATKKLNAATVLVNDHTAFRVDWMPFGGRRHSGLGVGGIPYSMNDMTEEKLIVIKSSVL